MISQSMKKLLIQAIKDNDDAAYVYDFEKIKEQINKLKLAFPEQYFRVLYAIKANSNISILKLIDSLGVGFDACSIEELFLLQSLHVDMKKVFYNSDCLSYKELVYAKSIGANIIIGALDSLEEYCKEFPNSEIGLRVNTGFGAGHSQSVTTGGELSKFGISLFLLQNGFDICQKYGVRIIGLHSHAGSGINEYHDYLENAKRLIEIAISLHSLRYINFGGGFSIDYNKNLKDEFNLIELRNGLSNLITPLLKKYPSTQIFIEPGRYCVAEAGVLVAKVVSVKKTKNIIYLGLNTGYNHFARCFLYGAYHDIENITSTSANKIKYDIVGYLCQAGDVFARQRLLCESEKGDVICIKDVGAYGYSLSSNFNSRLKPAEFAVINNSLSLIRHKERLENLLNGQSI
jgi:diaminopimelate decarboxylase